MKGIKIDKFVELTEFIQKYHRFALRLSDQQLAELHKIYPNMNDHGFNIKYIDSIYDSRDASFWHISFRGLGNNVCFHTNTDLSVEYDSLYDWILAYLTGDWKPTKEELESIIVKDKNK